MSDATLLLGALAALASAAAYGYVGFRVATRKGADHDRLAFWAFGLWWSGLASLSLVGAAQNVLWLAGVDDVRAFTAIAYITLTPFCIAIWGLFYFLAYLFSGRRGLLPASMALYGLLYVVLIAVVAILDPVGIEVRTWDVRVEYANTLSPAGMAAFHALLVVPIMAGAVAYGSLYFRVKEPLQRYRIGVVSLSLILWFGGPVVAQLAGINQGDVWAMVSRLIGLLAALAILLAYRPPARILRLLTASQGGSITNG